MSTFLDRGRKFTLFLSMLLIAIPGIKGYDVSAGHFSLGRLQPFKFAFLAWASLQTIWVLRSGEFSIGSSFTRSARLALSATILCIAALSAGMLLGGGGAEGWNTLISLCLGTWAAFITANDRKFPIHFAKSGLAGAVLVLLVFAILERQAPYSKLVVGFLSAVRDGQLDTFQLGSTLTPSALAEFGIRALPLFYVTMLRSKRDIAVSTALILLILGTMTRSGLLAVIALTVALGLDREYRIHFRKAAISGALLVALTAYWLGPAVVYGRFLGWIAPEPGQIYSESAARSGSERAELIKAALHGIANAPIFGIGLGGFRENASLKQWPFSGVRANPPRDHHAHNLFLEFGVSGGLPAMLSLVLLLGTGLVHAIKTGNRFLVLFIVGQTTSMMFDARIFVSWLAITLPWFASLMLRPPAASPVSPKVEPDAGS